jgi:hypothetical protein
MVYMLKEKLTGVKATIKTWHRETYKVMDDKFMKLISEITVLVIKDELAQLSEGEVGYRKPLFFELCHLKKSKQSSIVERSRARWLKEGTPIRAIFMRA